MHPTLIGNLSKKQFCCSQCPQSFDHATTLSRHNITHKLEAQEEKRRLDKKVEELQELIKKTSRERELELRNEALEKLLSESQQVVKKDIPVSTQSQSLGYVYLLQEREFIDKKQEIYKVGMTSQPNQKRFRSYPKGSRLLYQIACDNHVNAEKSILQQFKENFEQIKDIGSEYFKGCHRKMFRIMHRVVEADIDTGDKVTEYQNLEEKDSLTKAKKYDKIRLSLLSLSKYL
jgi:hypothetical protein